VPYLKGNDIAAYGWSEPLDSVDIDRITETAGASVWGNEARGEVVGVPVIQVTLCASVLDSKSVARNDSVLAAVPVQASAYALAGLINSLPSRYYSFLATRAAILLRRRSHFYPRTIEHLPCPDLDEAGVRRLDELSREAHHICAEADVDETRLVGVAASEWRDTRLASVLFDFAGWPDALRVPAQDVRQATIDGGALVLGDAAIRGDGAGLQLLVWLAEAQGRDLGRATVAAFSVPRSPEERLRAVAEIESRVAARGRLLDRLREVEDEIDETVMEGLGLSAEQKRTLRERCQEFPLSETVMRPRYLWSEDRKRQKLRRYEDGERYR